MLPKLTREELQICALLYKAMPRPKLITLEVMKKHFSPNRKTGFHWSFPVNRRNDYPFLLGTWFDHKVYVGTDTAIDNLQYIQALIDYRIENSVPFYVMKRREVFADFYKELDIQIAIGSL